MNKLRWFKVFLLILFCGFMQACVLRPYDGQKVVAATTDAVNFNGMMVSPNATVHLYFFNFNTNRYELFHSVRSASTPIWTTPDGDPLYYWTYTGVLPSRFWKPGLVSGAMGKLRFQHDATVLEGVLISVRRDWVNCWINNPEVVDFMRNCSSPNTPEATFYTHDFDDGLI